MTTKKGSKVDVHIDQMVSARAHFFSNVCGYFAWAFEVWHGRMRTSLGRNDFHVYIKKNMKMQNETCLADVRAA